ncbi:MAG: hypothetical protein A3H91_04175 [Gammaproteobacteria bacterium RIFCSPLOWO2_02_FULL_61_13]|nr:MAG: hypothetical protein A3H91_04175 [Gammaproteobacteria bacterium RIFCSPLOWO2_02_FULL_61_13]
MGWPSHAPGGGRHDWATYIERGCVEPFRNAARGMPDVDAPVDEGGRSMLMEVLAYAGGEPWLEIVKLLIGAGADVNRRDAGRRLVWDFAPTSGPGCDRIWRALIQSGLDVNTRGDKNETALMRVCSVYDGSGDYSSVEAIVRLLLDAGAQVNVVDQYQISPLQSAAGTGNVKAVRVLLKDGADPNLAATSRRGALFEAAVRGHADVIQALLQAGARIDAVTLGSRMASYPAFTSGIVDVEGVTPLIAAAEGGHFQALRLLVDAGADVNRADASGFTPLMGAARAGHAKMVQFLLNPGARRDAVDAGGRNAQKHAAEFQKLNEIAPIFKRIPGNADPD